MMSNFWTVQFLKTEYELKFGFPKIHTDQSHQHAQEPATMEAAGYALMWCMLH